MTKLTKLTTPYGLLDKDTQEALNRARKDGKTIQVFTLSGRWENAHRPLFGASLAYRVKPEPVTVVNEGWAWCYEDKWSIFMQGNVGTKGTLTTTLDEDGRPVRAVWEADRD